MEQRPYSDGADHVMSLCVEHSRNMQGYPQAYPRVSILDWRDGHAGCDRYSRRSGGPERQGGDRERLCGAQDIRDEDVLDKDIRERAGGVAPPAPMVRRLLP